MSEQPLFSSMPMPRHLIDGSEDGRYSLGREWCGYVTPHWVVRFCGMWVASNPDERLAHAAMIRYAEDRLVQ